MNKAFKLLPLLLVLGLAGCRPANNNNGGGNNSGDTTGGDTTGGDTGGDSQSANDKAAEDVIKTIATSLFGSAV